jgi:2-polyprenyl-6-methoxyphenol hydroxylase-like FAD-dependent oxidoreductase
MVLNPTPSATDGTEQTAHPAVREVHQTTCVVVGGGPAGMILAYMLARQHVPVVLLEAHKDFDRDFRGDTLHPSAMEIIDELGLAERLLQRRHTRIDHVTLQSSRGPVTPIDLRRLKTKFPYITLMPQVEFLEFMAEEARRYPNLRVVMGARAEALIEESGVIRGVRYQTDDGWHEVRALLTVGADGRFSRIRRLSGLAPIKTSPPMDVLWFRIPRLPSETEGVMARFGPGRMLALLNRGEMWQAAYVILKGSYHSLREAGLPALRQALVELVPEFADRVEHLQDWKQVSLLSVESDRLPQWFRPGLLLIGDAAHTMSPIGGVGINYAIQDAAAAGNVLAQPLRAGRVRLSHLRAIQRQREWPTRLIQAVQALVQRRVIANVLDPTKQMQIPTAVIMFTRIPFLRDLPARLIGFGLWPTHVKPTAASRVNDKGQIDQPA